MLYIEIDRDEDGQAWQRLRGVVSTKAEQQLYADSLDIPLESVTIGYSASTAWREADMPWTGSLPDWVLA